MSDLNLFSEIVKTLDFSNASKDRLLQFIQQRDQRVISALTSFIKSRESAVQDAQKHQAMVQLKRELEVVLFGRAINAQNVTTTQITYTTNVSNTPYSPSQTPYTVPTTAGITYTPTTTTTNTYTTGISSIPASSTGNIGGVSSYTTQTYNIPSTTLYSNQTYGASTLPTNTAATTTTTNYTANQVRQPNSNSNSASNEYYANLMAQYQNQGATAGNGTSNQSQQEDGDDKVKRAAARNQLPNYQATSVQTKSMKNEVEYDNKIESIRAQHKPKQDQKIQVNVRQIQKEQQRLKEFTEKWQPGQPLHKDLYELFYKIVNELDFATFLSLRHKLHIDEIGVKDLVKGQQEILKAKLENKQTGINPNEFLTLMSAGSLNTEDVFYLLQIFFYLDFNNNGLLDADEILLGFVMLSNSSEKEKLEAAFTIVDEDGSGTLDISEMTTYMRSVIRMGDGRRVSQDMAFEHEFLIEKIAAATAQGIFKEMDLNFDNRISYEEFIVWHNLHGTDIEGIKEEQVHVQKILAEAKKDRNEKLLKFNAFTKQNEDYQKITNERLQKVLDSKLNESSINTFRQKLQLQDVKFLDAVHFLKEYKVSERLGFGAFFQFMKELYVKCSVNIDLNALKNELTDFYSAIDIDNNGFIDWNEILGAFSLLCTGTENEKVRGIFDVFDQNDDQILQFNELYTLFQSSFNLIFMRNPDSELARQDPAKLAFSMALSAFTDNNLDPYTHGLDLNTFSNWYKKFDII
ncbi:EF-hand pair protein (macronuclear) [Tetrahymena thermophila SB210]|uniref:EF-hand pair protein n=1 Tax=Tetrahymena thermophila (strain SB210) TaxID=312017 RepID=I7LTQ6_TETTS|nr:EF-hand pair protein [Tetrahymena thermophila SB210]EAR85671.3 EF-hand pair protein [Tetrahymena thermophila SB210]|eukprot:XP_001033334.3 EF-hand pair protein [Tetrahymena thermophila SB210]